MGFNFPNSPTMGQQWPVPATPGLPVYQWDGEKWITTAMPVTNQSGVIAIQVFTTSGTYVPSAGMTTCVIECVGGGGGGASMAATATTYQVGGGGGSGAYARKTAVAAVIGTSQPISIGAGGAAGTAGGDTSAGTLCIAKGAPATSSYSAGIGGPKTGSVGDFTTGGNTGDVGDYIAAAQGVGSGGAGGNSLLGAGGAQTMASSAATVAGASATGYGGGGAGGGSGTTGTGTGGAGAPGVVIITEYGMSAITGTDGGVVHYDAAQSLTASQLIQARQNIYAAPFDAMSYSGMQINGSCEVSQERGSTGFTQVSGTTYYAVDGWTVQTTSGGTLVMGCTPQHTVAPVGYQYSICLQAQTGKAVLGASDSIVLMHNIEGYRLARLAWGTASAQPITIGFWVCALQGPGTMAVTIRNGSPYDRTYITNVAINSTAYEYKTITVPGDTAGTWAKANGLGLQVMFCFGAGSSYQSAPGVWTNGGFATSSTTNFMGATSNAVFVTGLVVLPGIEAPSATRSSLIMRPYDQELVTCCRYFYKWSGNYGARLALCYADTTTTAQCVINTPVPMRVPPSPAGANTTLQGFAITNVGLVASSQLPPFSVMLTVSGALTAGTMYQLYANTGGGSFTFDARL